MSLNHIKRVRIERYMAEIHILPKVSTSAKIEDFGIKF